MKFWKLAVFAMVLFLSTMVLAVTAESAGVTVNQLRYDPFPAESGKYLDLWMTVENSGNGTAKNVACELETEFPIYLQPDENATKIVGVLAAKESATIRYKLVVSPQALDEDKELDFKCRLGDDSAWITKQVTIQVKALRPEFAIGTITTSPEKLVSDSEDNKITMQIQNIGNESAKLVTTKLVLPEGFTSSKSYSDTYNLGTVSAESTTNAIYYIDVSEKTISGKHPAKLIVNYKYTSNGTDEYLTQEINFDLDVKPAPKFTVESITITPDKVYAGTKAEVKVKLKNTGLDDADAVSMKVYLQNDQPFDFDKKYDYIGDVKVNEEGEAVFSFTAKSEASAKDYLLKAEIRYTAGEEVKLETEQFTVTVQKKEGDGYLLIIGAVVVLLCGIGFYLWKKRK